MAGAERRFEEHLTGYTAYLRRPFAKFIVFYERMIHVASTANEWLTLLASSYSLQVEFDISS
jgi:hypothetical protein